MAKDEDVDMTPQQKVFNTAELLEEVLLYLPMKDVLLDQRVCKTWKNGIDGSIKLQKALFMRPAGEIEVEESKLYDPYDIEVETRYYFATKTCFINPLLLSKHGKGGVAHLVVGELTNEWDLPPSVLYPQASWRRMLVTQPPLPVIRLEEEDKWEDFAFFRAVDSEDMYYSYTPRIEFFCTLQNTLMLRTKTCTSAQDIEVLEAKKKAGGGAEPVQYFNLYFKKHGTSKTKGTTEDPCWVAVADVYTLDDVRT
ncbi:hypothetical protein PRZ48_011209 [Zasmidium cellare]|uniref:F-box domain-containing protein n=1 Tax=Zasmidium cellare TaxID=395010 RepID=A0ABR0EBA9_ZASCE|nr:hypothetical protein PRZ48_011209 [Zasmidium cellare]